jgi:PAS domain S-box-containing protein
MAIMSDKPAYDELERLVETLRVKAARVDEIYNGFFENSHSIKLIMDPESGQIVDANISACKYYGYTKDQLLKMNITDINTLSPEQVREELQKANLEKRNEFIFRHKLATGEIKDVEVSSGPIILAGKKVLYSIIHDISQRKKLESEREKLIAKLEKALEEIKKLKGILPICSHCKKIRDDKGYWQQIEAYISDHSEAEFSHSLCPDCIRKLYPELEMLDR